MISKYPCFAYLSSAIIRGDFARPWPMLTAPFLEVCALLG